MTRIDDIRRLNALLGHKWVVHPTPRTSGATTDERAVFEQMLAWLKAVSERQLSPKQREYIENRCCELHLDGVELGENK